MKIIVVVIVILMVLYISIYIIINNTYKKLDSGDIKIKGQDEFEANIEHDIKLTNERLEKKDVDDER